MKTIEQVKADFRRRGVNVSQWARNHGVGRMAVVDVLRGVRKGHRGEAHKAAVLLGIKDGVIDE